MDRSPRSRPGSGYKSPARSRSPGREFVEEADMTIRHLKKELSSLRYTSKSQLELRTKLSNLEHRYSLLVNEKTSEHEKAAYREHQLDLEITRLEEDLRAVRDRLESKDRDCKDLKAAFHKLQQAVEAKELDLNSLVDKVRHEVLEAEKLGQLQTEYENEKGNTVQDTLKCNEQTSKNETDIEVLSEHLAKSRRRLRELKTSLIDLKSESGSATKEIGRVNEELAVLEVTQRAKETTFRRLTEKARGFEGEIQSIDKEKEGLVELGLSRDQVLLALSTTKNDLTRKEASLVKERVVVEAAIGEADREIGARRLQVELLQHERLQREHELKLLKQYFDRLAGDNQKLLEGLREAEQNDARAARRLDRSEAIEQVLVAACRQVQTAQAVVRN